MKEEGQTYIAQLEEQKSSLIPSCKINLCGRRTLLSATILVQMKTHKRSTFAQNPRRENPLSLRHLFVKIPKMLSGEIIHNIALQHKLVFKFTSTIYWKKCLDILIIEKGLHGDWNGNPCFPTTALFNGRSYWRDAKWSLTFPETSRWWLSCHSWQGRGEARPKRFRHPTSRQETLHYPRQSGGIATQKGFFFKHWI